LNVVDVSLFSLSLLNIYEWCVYQWENDTTICFLVHLITQWFFSYLIFSCFSFPWYVINHTSQFSFTLYINICFLLSSWVFPLSYAINHTNQFLFFLEKNEQRKQQSWLPPTFEKRMKKGNNSRDWQGRVR
jgi:hypothetical protein